MLNSDHAGTKMLFDSYQVEIAPYENEYVAYILEMPTVSAYGSTPTEAIEELSEVYEISKSAMVANGVSFPEPLQAKKYSGKFNVRVPTRLHRTLAVNAARQGVSLNAFVSTLLTAGCRQ